MTTVAVSKQMTEKVDKYEYHETWALYTSALVNIDKSDNSTLLVDNKDSHKDDTNSNW